jgi:hypothetical protein
MENRRNPVIEMARSASPAFLGKEFDEFLQAPVGEDRNGMLLSVLSALARLDVDPWQEAAKLARLPGEAAARQLASLLATLPASLSARLDFGAIAARLVALLPREAVLKIPLRAAPGIRGVTINSRTVMFVIVFILMLAAQWAMQSYRQSATADNVVAPASSTFVPHAPISNPPRDDRIEGSVRQHHDR